MKAVIARIVVVSAALLCGILSSADQRPNILLIYIDDMGYTDLGCFGNPDVKTPRIDQLAAEGTRFTRYYSNSPICSPSRVAVATGHYPGRHRIFSYLNTSQDNHDRQMTDWLDPQVETIARQFRKAGYATGHFGKWHMGGGREVGDAPEPSAYGFDEHEVSFEGLGPRVLCVKENGEWLDGLNKASAAHGGRITKMMRHEKTAHQADMTIDFIRRHKDQPFYVQFYPNDVHTPYAPSDAQLKAVGDLDVHPFLRQLYAVLLDMDRQIGRVVDAIDEMGLGDRTLIVLTSDNGPNVPPGNTAYPRAQRRTGDRRGSKWSLYEGGINLPLIVRWTGRVPGGKTDADTMALAMDFFPTFCSIAGLPLPAGMKPDGMDIKKAFFGEPVNRPGPVFWEFGRRNLRDVRDKAPPDDQSPTVMVREGNWKMLVYEDGGNVELYDFSKKAEERSNVAGQNPEIAERLKKQALEWFGTLPVELKTHDGSCLHRESGSDAAEKKPKKKK